MTPASNLRWARRHLVGIILFAVVVLGLVAAGLVMWLNVRGDVPLQPDTALATDLQTVQRGAYLAAAGNCAACHTARGGAAYAGGRGVPTPFGTVFSSNLTPDPTHGLGAWSSSEFFRAMRNGRSRDGHFLYPVFPYPSFSRITRADSDALFVYLRSLPAVATPNRPHDLRFPFNQQAALAVWRALFFRSEPYVPDAGQSASWNRGAYLVQGLGHCAACHAARNFMGASVDSLELSGGLIPMQKWYAPSLVARAEAGVQDWPREQVEIGRAHV